MKLISRLRQPCFCAFCKARRTVYAKKHVDLTNVLGIALLSMGGAQAYYGQFDPRGIVLFCLLSVLSEIFIYMRWRLSIVCRLCGFDPALYKRSPALAAKKVRAFFDENAEKPEFQLSRSPLLNLHRQRKEQERKALEYKLLEARLQSKKVQKPQGKAPVPRSSVAPNKSV